MSAGTPRGQLFELCARPGLCTPSHWEAEPPLWQGNTPVKQLLLQRGPEGVRWYLLSEEFARVLYGDLGDPAKRRMLPVIPRCLDCWPAIASAGSGQMPYLLAASRVYTYETGVWWRRLWP
jgi:hypothetical protein